jgi:hypothetical protein
LKAKYSIALVISILMVLITVAGCSTPAPATTTAPATTQSPAAKTTAPTSSSAPVAAAKDKSYRVLNPSGDFVPVKTQALAPRLDTLKGKTIWVWQGESDPVIGPALYPMLQKNYPDAIIKYTGVSGMGLSSIEAEVKTGANAVVRLNGW